MGATACRMLYLVEYTCVVDVSTMIRRCRREAGLSQQALADAASTSQPTIAAYESGRVVPSVPTLTRVLEACGQTLSVDFDRVGFGRWLRSHVDLNWVLSRIFVDAGTGFVFVDRRITIVFGRRTWWQRYSRIHSQFIG